ncbi:MAG: translation initiation factor IF-2 [Candidatus Gracilibacteria bacterium]|nr:translation initiation factor IF-2 [Candidatus Gracilibacteria bacterium]
MTEKIIDDYYLNINQTDSTDEKTSTKKKLKFISKKPNADNNENNENSKKIIIKKTSTNIEIKEIKEKKVIIKKTEESTPKIIIEGKKDNIIKEKPKKTFSFNTSKNIEQETKKEKNNKTEHHETQPIKENKDNLKFSKKENTVFSQDKNKKFSFKKNETFNKEKDFSQEKNDRNKKFFKKNNFKKNYEYDDANKDTGFTRSNKINQKKKEEKNIEDINQNIISRKGEEVIIGDILTLKELSEKIGIPFSKLIGEFMKNGMMVNINSKIDFDSANIISEIFGVKLIRDNSSGISINELMSGDISTLLIEDDPTNLEKRPPIISIMGHVDHGKTSLLDYIRHSKVAFGEAGGITQSIGAYQVEQNNQKITFLDTPGHEAFTVMRARGAKSTDIAILVVAADEGVKPQTVESINHAKEAGIPIIVAINKMDKEGANPDNVKAGLSENGLISEEWGGDIPMIPVSAKTGFGVDDLLGVILLIAEMQELKANPNRNGIATVIESHLDQKLGPIATVIINTGTINKGDSIVCKDSFGKIKILKDYTFKGIKTAGPGDPAMIIGLDKVVEGGDILQVVSDIDKAKNFATEYAKVIQNQKSKSLTGIDLIMSKIKSGNLKQLKIVVKADTNGSLEAIKSSLLKLSTEETSVSIIHSGVGNINEGDILMCQGSEAILIGFRTTVLPTAKSTLEATKVEFINSEIIYHITEKIEKIITGMLDPKEIETILGKATVGGIFYTSKEFMIVGLKIPKESSIENNTKIRVIRGDKIVGKGSVKSLKLGVEEVKNVEGPSECGIKFVGNMSLEIGDILEIYKIEIKK